MKKSLRCVAVCLLFTDCFLASAAGETPAQGLLTWTELPPLPPAPAHEKQIGLAGTFAGIHNDALIVAGGANFPEALPWENGPKIWWEDIYVLERVSEGKYQWLTDERFKLPRPSAYGVSVSTPDGIVCIGGCDAEKCHKEVFQLKWDPVARQFATEVMPSLPRPLAFMAGAMVGNTLFVAGGQETMNGGLATKNFFALDLSKKDNAGAGKWRALETWPGPARIANLAVAQNDGSADCFYMFSGRNPRPGKSTEILTDAYKYNPATGKWTKLSNIALDDNTEPRCIMAGTAIDHGDHHILVLGGARGDIFLELEQLSRAITQAKQEANDALSEQLNSKHTHRLIHHPGFGKDVLVYSTITDRWDDVSRLPTSSHVTTSAVRWNGSIVIPSGEIRPGVRTPRIWRAETALGQSGSDDTPVSVNGDVARWDRLPDLPCSQGITGPFVGEHKDMLIIAGGTSLRDRNGETERVWHDDIWILAKNSEGTYTWIDQSRLDKARANGATVSTDQGIVCIGGNDASQTFADAVILSWDKDTQQLHMESLPNLPRPCTHTSATLISSNLTNTIYVAGGQSGLGPETTLHNFWALDLSPKTGDMQCAQWRDVLPWPGRSRASNLTISQHNGKADCVYVISGRGSLAEDTAPGQIQPLADVYEFNPLFYDAQTYHPETGAYAGQGLQAHPWRKRADVPRSVVAGAGIDVGQSHIFIFGGDDSDHSQTRHPGTHTSDTDTPNKLLLYHTITNTWILSDALPGNHMRTHPVHWDDSIVVAGGEIEKGVPTAALWKITPVERKKFFGLANFLVIGFYLAALIAVGIFFAFRQKNTDDFFRGGQRIPWFVAGCSIFATMLSSLTFIAIPAKAFMTDWTFIVINMGIVLITPVVVAYVLPFFRHIDATSAYEYLEKRFNVTARLFGSASFILFQMGRMAVVMFLTALPLAAITPLSVVQCILIMGTISIAYSTMGGLEAVVWTDTLQTFVLLGGALLSYVIVIRSLDGGFGDFLSIAASNGKFNMVNWDLSASSYTTAAIWVVLLGGIGQNLVPYVSDMAVVQRYMSVSDEKRAAKSIWTNAIMVIPATFIFFGLGAALFVFYQAHPEKLDPTLQNDAIFPLFIASELPIGIAGLVVAGVFSAAQSTLSTSMNSTSTAFVTDFIRRFNGHLSERTYLQMARVTTVLFGALGMLVAILLVLSDIKSLWDVFMAALGLLGSSMCGLFVLGMYTRRANGTGAVIGALAGAIGLYLVKTYTPMHFLLYTTVGIGLCFAVGYLVSLLVGGKQNPLDGLTVYTLHKGKQRAR